MKKHGRTSIHEFLGDRVVYRNLVPLDPRLPPLAEIRERLGLPGGPIPRKSQAEYAPVMAHLLREARRLASPGTPIERLAYVGDSRLDGIAFGNIARAGGWPGVAFIASEKDEPAQVKLVDHGTSALYTVNRWAALADFDRFCHERGLPLDERAAVIVDLDKTALGARGRNDQVIDRARVEAVRRTVGELLGDEFDLARFRTAYERINRVEFHPFTTDNQDYLAYICLILGSGLYRLETLVEQVRSGELERFRQFIARVDERAVELPPGLGRVHERVYARVQQGDPTPFKAFRYNEYRTTVERMGRLGDDAPVAELLEQEIVITQEVREMAPEWRERGALLFGLSDKPDEASIPTDDLAAQGYRAIHRVETHAVGG